MTSMPLVDGSGGLQRTLWARRKACRADARPLAEAGGSWQERRCLRPRPHAGSPLGLLGHHGGSGSLRDCDPASRLTPTRQAVKLARKSVGRWWTLKKEDMAERTERRAEERF